jgi:hypothetical protein
MEDERAPETNEELQQRINFLADSARAGMFAAGADMLEQLTAAGHREAPAIIMQAAAMMVAELHEQVAHQRGADKSKVKAAMLSAVGLYFDRYCAMSVQDAHPDQVATQ